VASRAHGQWIDAGAPRISVSEMSQLRLNHKSNHGKRNCLLWRSPVHSHVRPAVRLPIRNCGEKKRMSEPDSDSGADVDLDRRAFLKVAGKCGVVVPPAMTLLLSTPLHATGTKHHIMTSSSGGEDKPHKFYKHRKRYTPFKFFKRRKRH
jgi:hypothetical protein